MTTVWVTVLRHVKARLGRPVRQTNQIKTTAVTAKSCLGSLSWSAGLRLKKFEEKLKVLYATRNFDHTAFPKK